MRHSPANRRRPGPPPRSERKGIASRVMAANPRASREDAERVARAIHRHERERTQ